MLSRDEARKLYDRFGSRPLEVLDHVDRNRWALEHRGVVIASGIASEVVILAPRLG